MPQPDFRNPYTRWASFQDPVVDDSVQFAGNAEIYPFVTLGTIPFSFLPGTPRVRKPVCGGVWIGDDVEILSFTNVDRGTERDTRIGDGCRIDRFCHIAHDSILGKHCILAAGTIVAGFAELGDEVYCGINVSIKNRVKIGAGAKLGAGAVVVCDVPPGEVWVGNPARFLKKR